MNKPIIGKIAVNKILQDHLFKGKNDTYLDIAIWSNKNGEDDKGYTHYITQSFSKEAREAGVKGQILGNMKMPIDQAKAPAKAPSVTLKIGAADTTAADDDIPF